MARVAYLGPDYTFSHDLVRKHFAADTHLSRKSLHKVVEAVVNRECDFAVVPFYNTTRKSIEESQLEVLAHRKRVFVSDVIPLDVSHYLCGYCVQSDVAEIWSKGVVFHQISKWRNRHLPSATLNENFESTAAAVMAVGDKKPTNAAAVGTKSAAKFYGVPVIKPNIQNRPNRTLFFVLTSTPPPPEEIDHALVCLPKVTTADKAKLDDIVESHGCGITTNWSLKNSGREAYFVEVNGRYSSLGLHAVLNDLQASKLASNFLLGGYKGKCITRLLWGEETP